MHLIMILKCWLVTFFDGCTNQKEEVAENCYGGIKAIAETRFLQIFIFHSISFALQGMLE